LAIGSLGYNRRMRDSALPRSGSSFLTTESWLETRSADDTALCRIYPPARSAPESDPADEAGLIRPDADVGR
jgi:hypothetical protein